MYQHVGNDQWSEKCGVPDHWDDEKEWESLITISNPDSDPRVSEDGGVVAERRCVFPTVVVASNDFELLRLEINAERRHNDT